MCGWLVELNESIDYGLQLRLLEQTRLSQDPLLKIMTIEFVCILSKLIVYFKGLPAE